MKVSDVKIGDYFKSTTTHERWRVTDVGSRTVIAIKEREGWMNGPPYALAEVVFDEDDRTVCEVER